MILIKWLQADQWLFLQTDKRLRHLLMSHERGYMRMNIIDQSKPLFAQMNSVGGNIIPQTESQT